jgi:hypothetical protein
MTTTTDITDAGLRARSTNYKIGWWILTGFNGLFMLNHLAGPLTGFAEGDAEVFVFFSLAALNIYALALLLTAYRRGERWAWWITWVMVAIFGITILYAPDAGRYYLGAAVVMAVAQLLTWSGFRQQDRALSKG